MRYVAYGQFAIDWFYDNRYEAQGPKAVFIATKEIINRHVQADWLFGRRADGREFWTSPIGLFIIVDEMPPIYESKKNKTYDIPDPDWLYSSLKEKVIMPREFNHWAMLSLYYSTKPWKEKQALRDAQYERSVSELMYKLELPFTEELREATKKVMAFDYSYHNTDDINRWHQYNRQEKELLMTFMHYPLMMSYFTQKFKIG